MAVAAKKESEVWMERYAADHGLDGADDHQPDLRGGEGAPRPDYRFSRGTSSAIVEVKESETSTLDKRPRGAGRRNAVTLDARANTARSATS